MKGNHKNRKKYRGYLSSRVYYDLMTNAEYIELQREQYIDAVLYGLDLMKEVEW